MYNHKWAELAVVIDHTGLTFAVEFKSLLDRGNGT